MTKRPEGGTKPRGGAAHMPGHRSAGRPGGVPRREHASLDSESTRLLAPWRRNRPGSSRTWPDVDGLKALIALVEDVRVVGAGPERDVALAEALVLAVDLLAVAADA